MGSPKDESGREAQEVQHEVELTKGFYLGVHEVTVGQFRRFVDVTNYVLHETCQPLHAFDAAKIKGGKLCVRMASEGETITTLDDVKRTLNADMAVIADAERPLVVAGVMGSVDAGVDCSTTDIVLEAAGLGEEQNLVGFCMGCKRESCEDGEY